MNGPLTPLLLSSAIAVGVASSDVTAQCALVADFNAGSAPMNPTGIDVVFGTQVYLTGRHATHTSFVFKWDEQNGLHVLDPNGGTGAGEFVGCCTPIGPRVFFAVVIPGFGKELWMTDGTAAGTVMVEDIRAGASSSHPWNLGALDDRVLFAADDGVHGRELWVSDGTGASMVVDTVPGGSFDPGPMTRLGDNLLFTARDAMHGRELWASDGTAQGTVLLNDIHPGSASSHASTGTFVRCGDHVYFPGYDGTNHGLWKTDGTPAGTVLVAQAQVYEMCACDGTLFFSADFGSLEKRELYKTDGTTTVLVKDIAPSGGSNPRSLTCSNGRVFFVAAPDGLVGQELFVSDGTTAGTYLVKDIEPAAFVSSSPHDLVAAGAGVCFGATLNGDDEVWFSDGTAVGTYLVCDIDPNASSHPDEFFVCNGHVFFSAVHPTAGRELFRMPTPGATHTVLGEGGRPDHPTLALQESPVLGTAVTLRGDGPAGHASSLLFGPSGPPANPFVFTDGGCDWVGLFAGTSLTLASFASPTFAQPIPIPNQPALEGARVNFQAVFFDLSATPPLQLSNGIMVVLGPASPH